MKTKEKLRTRILDAVAELEGNAYSNSIKSRLKVYGLKGSLGVIGVILTEMENDGLVESKLADATRERGWRRKRLYSLTDRGRKVQGT